ncbi:MAG: TMEM165/GDT1 family protein, partial [Methylococcales bacterium]|nr:TMEM165/GDT1 family protein [Methylococcales bacterium]
MEKSLQFLQDICIYLSSLNYVEISTPAATSFVLIAAAEIGDKSQLVCMTLAARHRATPVLFGAITAFAFLNCLAVIFGSAIANWFPDYIVSATVALLFAIFGIHSLRIEEDE